MKSIPVIAALLIALILLHVTAVYFYLYWTVWWFDIVMHVLGGLVAGLIAGEMLPFSRESRGGLLAVQLVTVLLIGIAWELYEYGTGMTFAGPGQYVLDTTLDLFSDVVGGMVAYLAVFSKHIPHEQKS